MPKQEKITFEEHRNRTAEDCDALAKIITDVGVSVRRGNLDAYEKFFIEGGTNEGDAKINELLERLALRFFVRKELVE